MSTEHEPPPPGADDEPKAPGMEETSHASGQVPAPGTAAADPTAYTAAYAYPPGYAPSYTDYYNSAYYYSAYPGARVLASNCTLRRCFFGGNVMSQTKDPLVRRQRNDS